MEKYNFSIAVDIHTLKKIESTLLEAHCVKDSVVVQYKENEKYKLVAFIVRNSQDNSRSKETIEMLKFMHPASDNIDANISEEIVNYYNNKLEETVVNSVYTGLKQNNIFGKQGEWISKSQIGANLSASENKNSVLIRWLDILTDKGYLNKYEKLFLDNGCGKDADELWGELKKEPLNYIIPECVSDYIRKHTDNICDLFKNTCNPLNFLFPAGTTTVAEKLYGETAISRYLNNILADIIYEFSKDRSVKILEVGGGIGATTNRIAKKMQGKEYDYMFTDLSLFFLNNIKSKYPFIQTKLLDLDNIDINTDKGLYNIIVAAGVFNVTKNIPKTINNLVSMLDDCGIILFTEPVREHIEIDASQAFMMLKHEDIRKCTGRWYLSESEWEEVLNRQGLELVRIFPSEGNIYHGFGYDLFIACKTQKNVEFDFQGFLKKRLPEYMIPHEYYFIEKIPTNSNGEVDRNMLSIEI